MIFLNSLLKCIKLSLKLAETNLESVTFNSLSGLKLKRKKKKGGEKNWPERTNYSELDRRPDGRPVSKY